MKSLAEQKAEEMYPDNETFQTRKSAYVGGFITGWEADKWIAVEETPPAESGRYWCYVEEVDDLGISHYQWNCAYSANDNRWSDKALSGRVTHWQNLPSPPKQ